MYTMWALQHMYPTKKRQSARVFSPTSVAMVKSLTEPSLVLDEYYYEVPTLIRWIQSRGWSIINCRRVWLSRARTRIFVTAQEVVVEPLHLTCVEMQFRRRQVQLLVGAKTAPVGLDIARPAAHGSDFSHVATENGLTWRLFRPPGNRLRKNTSGHRRRPLDDIVSPPTRADLWSPVYGVTGVPVHGAPVFCVRSAPYR